jgi:hypothetical protein
MTLSLVRQLEDILNKGFRKGEKDEVSAKD